MFSFFKRGKSKEDSDKKEKLKSFSPFTRRHDSKKDTLASSSNEIVGESNDNSEHVDQNGREEPTNPHGAPTVSETNTDSVITPITPAACVTMCCDVADQSRADEDEDSGKEDRAEGDAGFQTQIRADEDEDEDSGKEGRAEGDVGFHTQIRADEDEDSGKEGRAEGDVGFHTQSQADEDEDSGERAEDPGFQTAPNTSVLAHPLAPALGSTPTGPKVLLVEVDYQEHSTPEHLCLTKDMCEEIVHGPSELYDIAEEASSEEENQSEEDAEESEDEDDSGNVTQPTTFDEEYSDDILIKKNMGGEELVESTSLLRRIEDLQHEVMVKTGGMDRLQAELNASYKESEFVRKRLRKVEEDLNSLKQKNRELAEELQRSPAEVNGCEGRLEEQVGVLEQQLEKVRTERDGLEQRAAALAAEQTRELSQAQQALDEVMTQKEAIQERFERDFEKLRTENTDREQHLLDDFEWKLRQVEQTCKRRLEDKTARVRVLEDKLKAAEQDLSQVERLRQFESEACLLRGLNLEQQRALRIVERTKEELQVSEKVLKEEIRKLNELLEKEKAALTTMQAIHNREIEEKERKTRFRLDQQRNDLNNQWDEKLRKETIRLKVEMDQIFRDEKRTILETARVERDMELLKAKEKWENRFQDFLQETECLKETLINNEEEYKHNIETVRSNADRDIFELRRKLDKIDISYQEKIERIQSSHEKEKERLIEEAEHKLQTCEQNYQLQLGSTRTTLELVKEQLKREAASQLQDLVNNHRRQLEEQWEQLMQERDEAMADLAARHRAELASMDKTYNTREQEIMDIISRLQQEDCAKSSLIEDLTTQSRSLNANIKDLAKEIHCQKEQFKGDQAEWEKKLRLLERGQQHWQDLAATLQARVHLLSQQLEESKDEKLVEELRKALSEKELQVAQLSKEKHLYQLEVMNRNGQGTATARQRRKGGHGKSNKLGSYHK